MNATRLKETDAVIVGAGLVGSILARELTRAGLRVAALERGARRSTVPDLQGPQVHNELRYSVRKQLMRDATTETFTLRNSGAEVALPPRFAGLKPGTRAQLDLWRRGSAERLTVAVGELKENDEIAAGVAERLGLALRPLTPEKQMAAGARNGLVVERASGAAAQAGAQPGDVVLALNGKPLSTVDDLRSVLAGKYPALHSRDAWITPSPPGRHRNARRMPPNHAPRIFFSAIRAKGEGMKHSARRMEAFVPRLIGAAAMVIAVPLALIPLGVLFAVGLALVCAAVLYNKARKALDGRSGRRHGGAVIDGEFRVLERRAE